MVLVLWLSMPRWARSLTSWAALRRVPLVALEVGGREGDGALAAWMSICRPATLLSPQVVVVRVVVQALLLMTSV